MRLGLIAIVCWLFSTIVWAQERLVPVSTILHPEILEPSGMVRSGLKPDLFWVHNDSGDVPRLFAVNLKGRVTIPYWLAAKGQVDHRPATGERVFPGVAIKRAALNDWEDITRMAGRLYIAETGNNGNARRDMGLYELFEPNAEGVEEANMFQYIPIAYPEQTEFPPTGPWEFDCEAIFAWSHHIYFVTKNRPANQGIGTPANSANLYRLDTMDPLTVNTLVRVDRMENTGGWVTAADASDDGEMVAILVERPTPSIWLFDRPSEGDRFFSQANRIRRFRFEGAGQVESLSFNGPEELIMLNEKGELYRIALSRFSDVAR